MCAMIYYAFLWLEPVEVSRYSVFKMEEQKLPILDNVYITHWIVGYTQTIDLLCMSANLVSVSRVDRIKLGS